MSKVDSPSGLKPLYSFDQLVIGPHNNVAVGACLEVVKAPGDTYNPLFIYGPPGVGKTHLIQAVAHQLVKKNPDFKIRYISAERFMNEILTAISEDRMLEIRRQYSTLDMLIIDDVQYLTESKISQEELFHIFNNLHHANCQVILAADRPPNQLTTLNKNIRSRLEWGLSTDITIPDEATRIEILKKKQEQSPGIQFTEEMNFYAAKNLKSNVRELEGFLKRIHAYVTLSHQVLNMDMVESVVKELSPEGSTEEGRKDVAAPKTNGHANPGRANPHAPLSPPTNGASLPRVPTPSSAPVPEKLSAPVVPPVLAKPPFPAAPPVPLAPVAAAKPPVSAPPPVPVIPPPVAKPPVPAKPPAPSTPAVPAKPPAPVPPPSSPATAKKIEIPLPFDMMLDSIEFQDLTAPTPPVAPPAQKVKEPLASPPPAPAPRAVEKVNPSPPPPPPATAPRAVEKVNVPVPPRPAAPPVVPVKPPPPPVPALVQVPELIEEPEDAAAVAGLKEVGAVFFYPEGSEAEMKSVVGKFQEVIKKHKLKFRLKAVNSHPYVFKGKINYSSFVDVCKANKVPVAIVIGPPLDNMVPQQDFYDLLTVTLDVVGISLQLINWTEINKDYRYLNLSLDIALVRSR